MYLGIDLGTSGVKVMLMDETQAVVGSATAALTVSRPRPGWSEQAPADWIAATRQALAELRARHDLGAVRGVGLSGQMHGAVALDAADAVRRAQAESGGRVLGEIEEDFADTLTPGDTFLFAGEVLRFEGLSEDEALATRAGPGSR